jgi:hypothetical protein
LPWGGAAACRNLLAWRKNREIAGLLQWSEVEAAVVVLTDKRASVHLIGAGAGIERPVRAEAEVEGMIRRTDVDAPKRRRSR